MPPQSPQSPRIPHRRAGRKPPSLPTTQHRPGSPAVPPLVTPPGLPARARQLRRIDERYRLGPPQPAGVAARAAATRVLPPRPRDAPRRLRTQRTSTIACVTVAAFVTYGCSLCYLRLQPPLPTVTAPVTYGYSLRCAACSCLRRRRTRMAFAADASRMSACS